MLSADTDADAAAIVAAEAAEGCSVLLPGGRTSSAKDTGLSIISVGKKNGCAAEACGVEVSASKGVVVIAGKPGRAWVSCDGWHKQKERERGGGRERGRETQTNRQTDKQTNTHTHTQRQRKARAHKATKQYNPTHSERLVVSREERGNVESV